MNHTLNTSYITGYFKKPHNVGIQTCQTEEGEDYDFVPVIFHLPSIFRPPLPASLPRTGPQEADPSPATAGLTSPPGAVPAGSSAFTWAFAATAPVGGPSVASSSRWIQEQCFFPRPLQAQRQYQLSIVPPPFAGSFAPAHHSINSPLLKSLWLNYLQEFHFL